jgi:putative transposase
MDSASLTVRTLKGTSDRNLRQERPEIGPLNWKDMLWIPSSFAANRGGELLPVTKRDLVQEQLPL